MKMTQTKRPWPQCFWKQAGVVKKKECYQKFSCHTCQFDKAMTRVCADNERRKKNGHPMHMKRSRFIHWKDRLRSLPLSKRLCIHHMKGAIKYKNCSKSYHCTDCEFDQYFYDQFKVNAVLTPVEFEDVAGISLPSGYYLHPGHTWIKIEDQGMVRIGIDDFSSRLFGQFDVLDVPVMGKTLVQGEAALTLMRNRHTVSFLSPVSGVITQVNTRVRKKPEMIGLSPYTDGWIFMVYCPDLKKELKQLMFMNDSKTFMEQKVKYLYDFLEKETQLAAADGGTLVSDIYGSVPGLLWDDLVSRFIPQSV